MTKNAYPDLSSERLNSDARLLAGCTLKEILALFLFNLVGLSILFFTLSYLIWGRFLVGFMGVFLGFPPVVSWSVIKLGQLKKSKPLFYCHHKARRTIWALLGIKDHFLLKAQIYSVRRQS